MSGKYWLAALAAIITLAGTRLAPPPPVPVMTMPRVIRFRVIANSDNPRDQAIKLDVRDRVLETLDPVLNGVKSRRSAQLRIHAMQAQVARVANQVLRAHHLAYHARVLWTHTLFPTKAYGTWVLPAGRYQALLIVLGRGAGHNWWCVLYPSLCFVDMGNALAVPTPTSVGLTNLVPSRPGHRRHRPDPRGRIRVSWTTPRFILSFLAILR